MWLNNNRAGNSPDVTCLSLESIEQAFIKILIPVIPPLMCKADVPRLQQGTRWSMLLTNTSVLFIER